MATPKKKPEDLLPVGRKTAYKEEYNEQAYKLCLLGCTDDEMAQFFEVDVSTIHNWKLGFPKFFDSIKAGKVFADLKVANALYDSCTDRTVVETEAIKVKNGKDQEKIEIVETTKVIPADFRSQRFWLTNRKYDKWKDKHEVSGDPENPLYHNITVNIVKSGIPLDNDL
jgi:hypothetical protein